MIESQTISQRPAVKAFSDRVFIWLIAAYQALAVLILLIVPVLAISWFRTPFIGAFVENTLLFSGTGFEGNENWTAFNAGLNTPDFQLLSIDGHSINRPSELQSVLQDYSTGRSVSLETLDLTSNKISSTDVVLKTFTLNDQVTLFYVPYSLGIVFLLIGVWVYRLRRDTPAGKAFILFTTSSAIMLAALFDIWTSNRLTYIWSLSLALSGAGLLTTALIFPKPFSFVERSPILAWIPLLFVPVFAYFNLPSLYDLQSPAKYSSGWGIAYAFLALAIAVFVGQSIYNRFMSLSPVIREQSRLLFIGSMAALLPIGIWYAGWLIRLKMSFSPTLLLPLAFFPLATAYSMLRYRFASADYMISRAVLYAALTVLSVAFYILLVWGLNLLIGQAISADNPLLVGLMIFIVAALFNPLRDRLQQSVDSLFFRGRVVYQEKLQSFSQDLTQISKLDDILSLLHDYIYPALRPGRMHVFLLNPLTNQFSAVSTVDGFQQSDLRFTADSPLVSYLASEQSPVIFTDGTPILTKLHSDRARLALLSAELFVPMIGSKQLLGWLALSGRATGEPYGLLELSYLDTLCDQSGLAVERAQIVVDLQRRVHEMNVLGRVAHGINVTLEFDDILELIYAQTSQVVPVNHFRITLHTTLTDSFSHVFYLDNGERITDQENRPIPKGLGLEQIVIRGNRAIYSDDYDSECRRRSVIPAHRDIYAWLGVPLNAGMRTIGALCLGSRDASISYTDEQIAIIQSIADQAAGAITKTQLLAESEERTRQLETLNQVARSLTLELELDPLLNRILESAVQMINCEAGSLFLIEEDTGDLIFSVVVGGAEELVGTRLSSGTGLVGKCVDTGRPIIQNDVQSSKDWFEKTDQKTGFTTRGLLVVPMQVRDEMIGVIEVINKNDQTPFSPDDERLLMAYSAQAAIAVQNARLFRMTDQALADRVDELSVMQRIDRELNTSLDLPRAMRITLEWAMRQSNADAGLVAVIEDGVLQVAQIQGYAIDLNDEGLNEKVAGLTIIQDALTQTQVRAILKMDDPEGLDSESKSQIAVSILRDEKPIGVLLLESLKPFNFSAETMEFLNRLSEHAAIAIANASLYSELQEANIAKSDFISFVSHELKTPMTSIKGYADLLAQGAVGEINEAQEGFLATIRSNVNRMATLVSDLADISRIEAGRLRLDYGPVSIQDVVEEVVRSSERQVETKAQQMIVRVPDALPPVWGDRTRLVQVLTNLVSNAVKYTPDEGTIRVVADISEMNGPENIGPHIQVAVVDSGIGIRPDEQKQIFTKFFRSEDLKAREVPGTGLGLNITKNLVELQGGKIWFETAYRKGSTFYFTIPIAETA